jgi:hypothetical protein
MNVSEEFLKTQASENLLNRELRKLRHLVENTKFIAYEYAELKSGEEKVCRIVLDADFKDAETLKSWLTDAIFYLKTVRIEIKTPTEEIWKFVMSHLDDDIGLDTSDHKELENAFEKGLIVCYLDQKLRLK